MSVSWIAPMALAGAGLIALPIAIHLLVRHHARTLAFPSLRFLRQTQLAALRRRTIQDAALLLCRAAIIVVAAMALAGPVLRTSSRTAGAAARVSRAVVVMHPVERAVVSTLMANTFASASFERPVLADSLTDAVRWLNQQPASAQEIVMVGALRRGSIVGSDLAAIPSEVGIRFQMVPTPVVPDVSWPVLARRNGALVRLDRAVHIDADATRVTDGAITPVRPDLVSITARPGDQALANAALRAALDAGVPWRDFETKREITWDVAPSPESSAADVVLAALAKSAGPYDQFEPVAIAPEQLNKWSRSPGPVRGAPGDEGDRRWMWAMALALIGVESWLRRSRSQVAALAVA